MAEETSRDRDVNQVNKCETDKEKRLVNAFAKLDDDAVVTKAMLAEEPDKNGAVNRLNLKYEADKEKRSINMSAELTDAGILLIVFGVVIVAIVGGIKLSQVSPRVSQ